MKNLKKHMSKIFVFATLALPSFQANTLVVAENKHALTDTRCFNPNFRSHNPAICYYQHPELGLLTEEWYLEKGYGHRRLHGNHFEPFHKRDTHGHMGGRHG